MFYTTYRVQTMNKSKFGGLSGGNRTPWPRESQCELLNLFTRYLKCNTISFGRIAKIYIYQLKARKLKVFLFIFKSFNSPSRRASHYISSAKISTVKLCFMVIFCQASLDILLE